MAIPTKHFITARLKIQWAYSHILQLEQALGEFFQTDFCAVRVEKDPNPPHHSVLKLEVTHGPPIEVAMMIGDAVHNLRAALDHVTSQIVATVDAHDRRVTFPMDEERDNLVKSSALQRVKKAAPDIADLILNEIKPYKAGNYAIWALGKVDNVDKHRFLITTVSVRGLEGVSAVTSNGGMVSGIGLRADANGSFPMIGVAGDFEITNKGKPTAEILFREGDLFKDQPVVPTLKQLAQLVLGVVQALETHFFGKDR